MAGFSSVMSIVFEHSLAAQVDWRPQKAVSKNRRVFGVAMLRSVLQHPSSGVNKVLSKEPYHGHMPAPDLPSSRPQNLVGELAEATIGDFVTEKPPGKVSETLPVGKGTPL